jgi:hypothetical protein
VRFFSAKSGKALHDALVGAIVPTPMLSPESKGAPEHVPGDAQNDRSDPFIEELLTIDFDHKTPPGGAEVYPPVETAIQRETEKPPECVLP